MEMDNLKQVLNRMDQSKDRIYSEVIYSFNLIIRRNVWQSLFQVMILLATIDEYNDKIYLKILFQSFPLLV